MALPRVRSEPTAGAEPQSEEKPLSLPEGDGCQRNFLKDPSLPSTDKEEDTRSAHSRFSSESDSHEEETRGRARRSETAICLLPEAHHSLARQEHIEKETSEPTSQ